MSFFDRDHHEKSWVLNAIEAEAMRRAAEEFFSHPQNITVMGMTPEQVARLKYFYERVTGRDPTNINEEYHELEQHYPVVGHR